MTNAERLKNSRDLLLKLHKTLLDHERRLYEGIHGPVTAGQFLGLLLEDADFAWLRRFSTLIVDIDEMFAQRDGYEEAAVDLHIRKLRELVSMENEEESFRTRYQSALQQDLDAAARHGELRGLLFD